MGSCGGRPKAKRKVFRPIVVSGPSGSGKSTLIKRLIKEHKDCFAFCVSQYHFVSMEQMVKMIEEDEFIEHAKFSGHIYGTSKKSLEDVMDSGLICIMDIEMMGVKSMKRTKFNARYIFIKTSSIEVLTERLRGRGTEKETIITQRLNIAVAALEYAEIPGSYDHIIENDDLDTAYAQLEKVLAKDIEEVEKSHQVKSEAPS